MRRISRVARDAAVELSAEAGPSEARDGFQRGFDDEIISWVSEPSQAATPLPDRDPVCPSCDLSGMMWIDSEREGFFCPDCRLVYGMTPPASLRSVACPGCGQPVEILESRSRQDHHLRRMQVLPGLPGPTREAPLSSPPTRRAAVRR